MGSISVQCTESLVSLSGSGVTGIHHARPLVGALFIQPLECRIFGIISLNCINFKTGDQDSRIVYVLPVIVVEEWFLMNWGSVATF